MEPLKSVNSVDLMLTKKEFKSIKNKKVKIKMYNNKSGG